MLKLFKKKKAIVDSYEGCRTCSKYQTLECPNSYYCFDTEHKPYYERRIGMNKQELNNEIKKAMKTKENERRDILRQILQEVKNKEINEKIEADAAVIDAVIKKLHKQIGESLEASEKTDNVERTEHFRLQLSLLEEYLPKILDGDELIKMIDEELAAFDKIDGRVMGQIMKTLGGKTGGNFNKQFAADYIKGQM